MAAGIAAIVKALKPSVQVIGVEPTGANAMAQSLVRGERVQLSKVDAFAGGSLRRCWSGRTCCGLRSGWQAAGRLCMAAAALAGQGKPSRRPDRPHANTTRLAALPRRAPPAADGVAIKIPGAECFRMCRDLLDGVVMVDNSAISTALKVGSCIRKAWGGGGWRWRARVVRPVCNNKRGAGRVQVGGARVVRPVCDKNGKQGGCRWEGRVRRRPMTRPSPGP